MGKILSTMEIEEQGECRDEHCSKTNSQDEPNMEGFHRIDLVRWNELMYSLQSIAKAQTAATRARIEAREKRREATHKRQDVWIWDAKFMGEIQRLNAQGKLQGFEELSRLAAECQNSRDLLGPLEQDSIEAESRWQGQIWKLKEFEEDLYTDFEEEFKDAVEHVNAHGGDEISNQPFSDSGSQVSVVSDEKNKTIQSLVETSPIIISDEDMVEIPAPLNFIYGDVQELGDQLGSDLDSGFGDIDSILGTTPVKVNNYGMPKAVPKIQCSGIELYHEILEDFSTRRGRVNKWLEKNALESRLESLSLYSVLQKLLELEDQKVPSNWADLVVAYWDLDEASRPVQAPQHGERYHGTRSSNARLNNSSSKEFYENELRINAELASEPFPSTQPEKQKHSSRSDEDKNNHILSDPGLVPKPIPPSPPDSLSNSRSASCDIRRETRPP